MKRLALLAVLVPAVTFAQEPPPPLVVEQAQPVQSVLPNLFATALGLTIEARFDYSDIDEIDLTIFNAHAHVQYLTPQGFGGYVRVAYAYVEDTPNDDSPGFVFGGSGMSNLEVGGLYVTKLGPNTDLLARGGVFIDTASEDDDAVIALSTVLPRLIDLYPSGLQTTWGRGQAQIRHSANKLRFGAALGMDVPLAGDGADQGGFTGLIHGVAAAGFQQGHVGIGFSLVMVQILDDNDEGEDNVMGLNLDIDYLLNPSARLFAQIGLSLEDNADGTSLGIGTRASF